MKANESESGQTAASQRRTPIHGAHLRTLEAVFRHPPAHNLEWMDVVALIEKIGAVQQKGGNKFSFDVGGDHFLMHKPHTKDLTSAEVVDLRHFLERVGWSPAAPSQAPARPDPAPPTLMVVVDHHGAKIYRIDTAFDDASKRSITPYDPHHFLHHLTHKDQSREQGQRAPEEPAFYKRISDAVAAGGRIVVIGHGTGKSNAARHLIDYLRMHHSETYQRTVREIVTDLSAVTTPQLLALAERALGQAS
ncbi:MAG TPA: hypothetical protein VMT09_11310 [Steroidobacteraceae bacterium]|nr:hypothetical protein [Steroidobacteraceae bacterium]